MIAEIGHATLQLVGLGIVLGAVEWCYPNRPEQKRLRPQFFTDLAFYFGQHVIWLGLELAGLVLVGQLFALVVPAEAGTWFGGLPWIVQALSIVLIGDVVVYWYHRASHDVSWLWTFHRVHHSSLSLDWLAAHREHPIDGFLTQVAMNIVALVLGVGVEGLAWLVVFRGVWAAFIHSNVRLPIRPLRWLVGAPELHHWHHANVSRTLHNFSNLAPWTDILFGTYHCPSHQRHDLGLPGKPVKSYAGWILAPHRDP
jgi:sterol desaturase/sphingolipid hydroxylase (fatty acid hydroxylase superfamily)